LKVVSGVPAMWAGLVVVGLAGCSRDHVPDPGLYRVVIEAPEGEIPFGLEIDTPARDGSVPALFLVEDDRRIAFDGVTLVEKALDARLPGGAGSLTVTARGGTLSGYLHLPDDKGSLAEYAVTGESGVVYRFFRESTTDNADVAGRWSVTVNSGKGNADWVLVLAQSHDQVEGSFQGPGGLMQDVTGQVQGDTVRLSSFDGHVARLFSATVNDDGELEGEAWSNVTGPARWSAVRNPDAMIEAEDLESSTPL
jgi:hypothetical protein